MIVGSITTVAYNVGSAIFSDTLNRTFCRCDGRTLTIADYPKLYSYIGTRYSDGTQTALQFRIPDLRGSFLRGADPSATVDVDAASRTIDGPGNPSSDAGSRQNRALFTHTHTVYNDDNTVTAISRREWEPTGSVISNAVHSNITDPRFPSHPQTSSSQTTVTANYNSSPEPTATSSPNHIVCDYIIRLA